MHSLKYLFEKWDSKNVCMHQFVCTTFLFFLLQGKGLGLFGKMVSEPRKLLILFKVHRMSSCFQVGMFS